MHELLQGLGWTDTCINVMEILFYVILILSGLIALGKQFKKCITKLIPKVKEAKHIKTKLYIVKDFLKWITKSLKDGTISDDEVDEIDKRIGDIINTYDNKKDDIAQKECDKLMDDNKECIKVGDDDAYQQ